MEGGRRRLSIIKIQEEEIEAGGLSVQTRERQPLLHPFKGKRGEKINLGKKESGFVSSKGGARKLLQGFKKHKRNHLLDECLNRKEG